MFTLPDEGWPMGGGEGVDWGLNKINSFSLVKHDFLRKGGPFLSLKGALIFLSYFKMI